MDIDSVPFGTDFRAHIDTALGSCKVLLALIGPNWTGKRLLLFSPRIFNSEDPVRVELETALRKKIPVIPVLLDGTVMPSRSSFKELKDFPFLNAADLSSGRDFDSHVDRIMRSVQTILRGP